MTNATLTSRERTLAPTAAPRAEMIERAHHPVLIMRPATREDFPEMLAIFRKTLAAGDTYALDADTSVRDAYQYWFGAGAETWVAQMDGRVLGMYRIIVNQLGRGSHVANASFVVDPDVRGRGLGLTLGRHCLAEAKKAGFLAMQFNMVVSTNAPAVTLWKKLGFAVVGTLPRAFRHRRLGLVDAYVMYREL